MPDVFEIEGGHAQALLGDVVIGTVSIAAAVVGPGAGLLAVYLEVAALGEADDLVLDPAGVHQSVNFVQNRRIEGFFLII